MEEGCCEGCCEGCFSLRSCCLNNAASLRPLLLGLTCLAGSTDSLLCWCSNSFCVNFPSKLCACNCALLTLAFSIAFFVVAVGLVCGSFFLNLAALVDLFRIREARSRRSSSTEFANADKLRKEAFEVTVEFARR